MNGRFICWSITIVVLAMAIAIIAIDYANFNETDVRINYNDSIDYGDGYVLYSAIYRTPEGNFERDWKTEQEWMRLKRQNRMIKGN